MITAHNQERISTDLDPVTPSVLEKDILKHSAACVFSVLSKSAAAQRHCRSLRLISPPSIPITVRGRQAEDGCSQRVNKRPQSKNDSICFHAALPDVFLWCRFLHIWNPNLYQLSCCYVCCLKCAQILVSQMKHQPRESHKHVRFHKQ